jgi:tRNA(Ile)-lysidine synthetase-like protein
MELPIAKPPWTLLGRRLESLFRKAFFEFDLLEGRDRVMVALSGGKDSLALLYLLKAISGMGFPKLEICAVHVAGEFSCGASLGTNFLGPICKELGVPLVVKESSQRRENLECYSCSRERRRLIFDTAREMGIDRVAFGHHRDDSVETLLMNLLHKAEFAGNLPKVPMHDFGVTIIRPLIYFSEREIREFAKIYGFNRISCQCPVGQTSQRRKTKEILDQLEEEFPHVRANLAQASLRYGSQKALKK